LGTVLIAVALAAVYAQIRRGGTRELPGFFIWSLPLGLTVALLVGRTSRAHWHPLLRSLVAGVVGLAVGIGWIIFGWLLVGGWMLAWDFPVLYCWTIAAVAGLTLGSAAAGGLPARAAATGFILCLLPLSALWWYGNRPEPGVLIVYRDHPDFDAAQRVLDSVLTRPHPGGGRNTKWPTRSYLRTRTAEGEDAALITVDRREFADSIRAALEGEPLVARVVDTAVRQ
jgi:hypothetical protein